MRGGRFKPLMLLTVVVAVGLGVVVGIAGDPALASAIVVAIILLSIILYEPSIGVLVYAAARPFADMFVFVQVGGISIGQLWGAGLIAVCGLYMLLTLRRSVARDAYSLLPLALPFAYFVFIVSRPGFAEGLTNALRLLSWTMLMVVVARIAVDEDGRRRIVKAVYYSAILNLVAITLAVAQNRYGAAYYSGQFEAIGQGPHGLSSYMVLCSVVLLYLMLQHEGGRWPFVLFGLSIVAVLLSLVRTTFLAMVILVVVYTFLAMARRGARVAVSAVALLGIGATIIYFGQDLLIARFRDLGYLAAGGGSEIYAGSGRIGIWEAVWAGAISSGAMLLAGGGALASSNAVLASLGVKLWAHNDFLELLITGGIPLLLTYLALIGWLVSSGLRLLTRALDVETRNYAGMFLGGVGAFVFMAFFNGIALYQASVVMGLLGGLTVGWVRDLNNASAPTRKLSEVFSSDEGVGLLS